MKRAKAFIFDLNGAMIDDMEYHATAWQSILNEDLKAGLSKEERTVLFLRMRRKEWKLPGGPECAVWC